MRCVGFANGNDWFDDDAFSYVLAKASQGPRRQGRVAATRVDGGVASHTKRHRWRLGTKGWYGEPIMCRQRGIKNKRSNVRRRVTDRLSGDHSVG